jgi:hypothetical protein
MGVDLSWLKCSFCEMAEGHGLATWPFCFPKNILVKTSFLISILVAVRVYRGALGRKGVRLLAYLAAIDLQLDQQVDKVAGDPVKRQPRGVTPKRKAHDSGHQDTRASTAGTKSWLARA